jgi:hypothetical protein
LVEKEAVGFSGKNIVSVLKRPLAAYPLLAANASSNYENLCSLCPIAKKILERN